MCEFDVCTNLFHFSAQSVRMTVSYVNTWSEKDFEENFSIEGLSGGSYS